MRVLAKQVVTIRAQKQRMQRNHAQLNGLKTMGSAMTANLAMSSAMAGTARVLTAVNQTTSVESMQAAMQEMEKSMQISEMQEEMLDDLLMDDDVEEDVEVDDVMSQVLDEIGLDLKESLITAPSSGVRALAAPKSPLVAASSVSPHTTASFSNAQRIRAPLSEETSYAKRTKTAESTSAALSIDDPLTPQEEAEAERLLAELGV